LVALSISEAHRSRHCRTILRLVALSTKIFNFYSSFGSQLNDEF
jgi:hypothetical protein